MKKLVQIEISDQHDQRLFTQTWRTGIDAKGFWLIGPIQPVRPRRITIRAVFAGLVVAKHRSQPGFERRFSVYVVSAIAKQRMNCTSAYRPLPRDGLRCSYSPIVFRNSGEVLRISSACRPL